MKNGKINCLVMFLILFVSLFFINIDGVKAGTIEGGHGKGYAQCAYVWRENHDISNQSFSANSKTMYRFIVLVWGTNSDGKNWLNWVQDFRKAGMTYTTDGSDAIPTTKDTTDEYISNIISSHKNHTPDNFYKGGKFTCPSTICISEPNSSSTDWRWGIVTCNNGHTFNLAENEWTSISQDGESDGTISAIEPIADHLSKDPGLGDLSKYVDNGSKSNEEESGIDTSGGVGNENSCEMLGGENSEFLELLRNIFTIMQVAGIGLCVLLSIWDAVTSLVSGEQDRVSKLFNRIVKRLIAVAILLILPVLIGFILDILELVGIEDIGGICIDQFTK